MFTNTRKEGETIEQYKNRIRYKWKYLIIIVLFMMLIMNFYNCNVNQINGSKYIWVDNSLKNSVEVIFTPRIYGIFNNFYCQTEIYNINENIIQEIKSKEYIFRQPMIGYYDSDFTFIIDKIGIKTLKNHHVIIIKTTGYDQIIENEKFKIVNDMDITYKEKQGWYFNIY